MHLIEPHYAWRHLYDAAFDENSPFFGNEYSEFEFTYAVYDHLIHPQWECFGSATLYAKAIFADYSEAFAIIELFGEWNDCLYNDIMFLKQNVLDVFMHAGIKKFILIGENVLNFHASDDEYYHELAEDLEEGWAAGINFRPHVLKEMTSSNIDYYFAFGGEMDDLNWRNHSPGHLIRKVGNIVSHRIGV